MGAVASRGDACKGAMAGSEMRRDQGWGQAGISGAKCQ